jgi:hypothetical protein
VLASPRNQLYRTGHPLIEDWPFLFAFSQADLDHLGNFADDLHVEAALNGSDDNTLKETAEHLNGRCQSKILNTWSGHRTAQIDPEKCRKINGCEIRF